jgi:hypothetical protein
MKKEKQAGFKDVFQFKIILKEIKPLIWRRVLVPETYSFWDLHVAIQNAMGWTDSHLHEFEIINPSTKIIDRISLDPESDANVLSGIENKLASYFSDKNPTAIYLYDFGDGWEHEIILEKILPRLPGKKYPQIIDGKRACPPENCGGPPGYRQFVKIMKNKSHPEYKAMCRWYGGVYDPEDWQLEQVHFDDPQLRYQEIFVDDVDFA